jgi:hypothetical protein
MSTLTDVLRAAAGQFPIHSPLGRFFTKSAQDVDNLNQSANAPRLAPGLWTCPSTVIIGDAVYASGVNSVAGAAGAQLATATSIGIVVAKPSPTSALVVYSGEVDVFGVGTPNSNILAPGQVYYLTISQPGLITNLPGGVPGQYQQRVGVAKNNTTLVVMPGDAILLKAA